MPVSRAGRSNGVLIAAEGLDGSGKSAGLDALGRWLEREGRRVHLTRWESSRLVRRAAGAPRGRQLLTPRVACLLAAAEAAERIVRDVLPRLERGDVVLADRYAWTAVARDVARGIDPAWAGGLYRFAPAPDLVVFHRQDTDAALVRALATRPTPAGAEAVGAAYRTFLERLVAGYDRLVADPTAGPWPVPVLVIPAGSSHDDRDRAIRERVRQAVLVPRPVEPVLSGA